MSALIAQNLAPIMFAALVAVLLLGYPVAFSLGAVGLLFFAIGVELAPFSKCVELSSVCTRVGDPVITLDWPLLQSLPASIYGIMSNDTLLAIPFFTFMGLILERSGMAEDLARYGRTAVRHRARRAGVCGDLRRRAAGGDYRRGGGFGDLDGTDLAADHAALRL